MPANCRLSVYTQETLTFKYMAALISVFYYKIVFLTYLTSDLFELQPYPWRYLQSVPE